MWVKSKNNIFNNSWEEAFPEDARGPLGGRERAKLKQNPKSPSRVSSLGFDGFQFVDTWIGEDMGEKGGNEWEICVLDRGKGSEICVFNFHDVSCLPWRVGNLQLLELNLNSG
ncbi:hypothetical protein L1987_20902 [Smallanthus sonchifolius]|uniref:Uncharacterized protein n=1 Tax=Smallanthus sonchifolius TaxID=185202 RepID=A0ACB9IT37_9ASTR|nr:hypothetical protein L1987_20902 [Smallanthus sonchifolius]